MKFKIGFNVHKIFLKNIANIGFTNTKRDSCFYVSMKASLCLKCEKCLVDSKRLIELSDEDILVLQNELMTKALEIKGHYFSFLKGYSLDCHFIPTATTLIKVLKTTAE